MKLLLLCLLVCGVVAQTQGAPLESGGGGAQLSGKQLTYKGRVFMFVDSPKTWVQAQFSCVNSGGNLVSIHSKAEDDFVTKMTGGKKAWIGFSDAQTEGTWLWINSKPVDYTNWCPGEPNNLGGAQNCAQINFSDKKCWDDLQCYEKLPFLCEIYLTGN